MSRAYGYGSTYSRTQRVAPSPTQPERHDMSSIWDDPDLRAGGDFIKFEKVGDSVSGTVTSVRKHTWDDGSVCPQLHITTDEGDEKTLTAGQVRLKMAITDQRPEPGDHIVITHTSVEKRAGGKTLKHFDVKVTRGGKAPVAAAASDAPF